MIGPVGMVLYVDGDFADLVQVSYETVELGFRIHERQRGLR